MAGLNFAANDKPVRVNPTFDQITFDDGGILTIQGDGIHPGPRGQGVMNISNNYEQDDFRLGDLHLQDLKRSAIGNALWRTTGTP